MLCDFDLPMSSFITFVVLLFVAAIFFVVIWFFDKKTKFENVFKVVAHTAMFLPIIVFAPLLLLALLIIYPLIGAVTFFALYGITLYVFKQLGLQTYVESLQLWSLMPNWGWFCIGSLITGAGIWYFLNKPLVHFRFYFRSKSAASIETDVQEDKNRTE